MSTQLIVCLVLSSLLIQIAADHNVEILLKSFANPDGKIISGAYCDPFWWTQLDLCDLAFEICVTSDVESDFSICANSRWFHTGRVTLDRNSVTFEVNKSYSEWYNPDTIALPGEYKSVSVRLKAWDSDGGVFGSDDLIDNIESLLPDLQGTVNATHRREKAGETYIIFEYQISCPKCVHGSCDGATCNCYNGWYGENCDIETSTVTTTNTGPTMRTCLHGGTPTRFGECICTKNFQGPNCEQRICQHGGTSSTDGESCICVPQLSGAFCEIVPMRHCADHFKYADPLNPPTDKAYRLKLTYNATMNASFTAFCDMKTDGGGWTVIQRRVSNTSFERSWNEYKLGFGDTSSPTADLWLGNDHLYELTNWTPDTMTLRIDIYDCDGGSAYEVYSSFKVESNDTNYTLRVGPDHRGTAQDSLTYPTDDMTADGMQFSTPDRDNDPHSLVHSAQETRSGWWFNLLSASNLNGVWYKDCKQPDLKPRFFQGISWFTWKYQNHPLKKVVMMIRPANF